MENITEHNIETECQHCGSKAKHTMVGDSTLYEEIIEGDNYWLIDHISTTLKCISCEEINLWYGEAPEALLVDIEEGISPEEHFFRFYKLIYPEIKGRKKWPFKVPKTILGDQIVHYLEQAILSEAAGLHTASVAMYRSVLESIITNHAQSLPSSYTKTNLQTNQIILNQDGTPKQFRVRNLHDRICCLTDPSMLSQSPKWVTHLSEDGLHAIRKFGNVAVHAGPSIPSYNSKSTQALKNMFDFILEEIYIDRKKVWSEHSASLLNSKQ